MQQQRTTAGRRGATTIFLGACAITAVSGWLFLRAHAQSGDCTLDGWADDVVGAWNRRGTIVDAPCYSRLIRSMDTGRAMRDRVIARFDEFFPRAGYKVVGLDPINAKLPGVDRPMVGVMYVSMFVPSGSTISLNAGERLLTEPDFLIRVKDDGVNDAITLEEVLRHVDRVYAFIEVVAPTFNNNPPNPFMMQASNLLVRWGVIGEGAAVTADADFLRTLETMRVTFRDGREKILAEQPGSYLGRNPLTSVLVVVQELKRRGEALRKGDLVSAGSYLPPVPVTPGMITEASYEGVGGTTLRVSASYR